MTHSRFSVRRRWRAGRIVLRRALRRIGFRRSAAAALPLRSLVPDDATAPLAARDAASAAEASTNATLREPPHRRSPYRQTAWQLAAVTGTVGIILLLLMQVSSLISPTAAGETQSVAHAAFPANAPPDEGEPPAEVQLAHNETPLPIPEEGLPPWEPLESARDPLYQPEPLPDVELALAVARYIDDSERFAIASIDDPTSALALTAPAAAGDDAWDPFDFQKPPGQSRITAIAAALGRDHDLPPLEPAEPETAPADEAEFDVVIEKHVPKTGVVYQPLEYEIVVRNAGRDHVPQMTIDELLPESQTIEHTRPAARISGQNVSWQLRDISPGEVRTLHVRTIPTATGPADAAAVVESMAAVMAETRVTVPRVRLEVLAPEHSTLGRLTKLTFRVTNEGQVDAGDLVLRTDLPDLLSHPLGRELDYVIGSLAPGEIREMTLTATAQTPGAANQRAEIVSHDEPLAAEVVRVSVEAPGLVLRREGLKQPPVGEAVVFTNHIANTSERGVQGLEVVETVPDGCDVVSVGDGGEFDPETRTLRWRSDELPAGGSITLNVTLRASRPGLLRSAVTVWSTSHPEQTMHTTVAPRNVVTISAQIRSIYPRSPVASGWPSSAAGLSSWPLSGGFRSGCAP